MNALLQATGEMFRQGIRDNIDVRKREMLYFERQSNIATAIRAMQDAGLDDNVIVQMLQKHWDLRRSEAVDLIDTVKE